MDMLTEFSKNTNSENHEFNFEIIKVLAEFINSACRYFRSYKINELKISPIKSIDTSIQQNKVIQETPEQIATPLEKLEKDPLPEKNKPQIEQNKNKTIEPPQNTSRSVSNTSKITKEKMLADRKKEMDNYVAKKKGMTKKNKLERIMNLKVKKPSVTSALKDYLNKSSDFQDSFSSKRKKNEQSFNDGSQSSLDEIRKAQKEIREMEATKTRIMMLYEKQVNENICFLKCDDIKSILLYFFFENDSESKYKNKKKKDAELEESQKLKDLILKEKDDETKMKEYLNKRKKEEQTEISSFRKELLMESRQQKKEMTENCKSNEIQSLTKDKEKYISIKREEEKSKKNKQREESNERLEHIQFIREQKKKQRDEEFRNQVYYQFKNLDIPKKKKKKKNLIKE